MVLDLSTGDQVESISDNGGAGFRAFHQYIYIIDATTIVHSNSRAQNVAILSTDKEVKQTNPADIANL